MGGGNGFRAIILQYIFGNDFVEDRHCVGVFQVTIYDYLEAFLWLTT